MRHVNTPTKQQVDACASFPSSIPKKSGGACMEGGYVYRAWDPRRTGSLT